MGCLTPHKCSGTRDGSSWHTASQSCTCFHRVRLTSPCFTVSSFKSKQKSPRNHSRGYCFHNDTGSRHWSEQQRMLCTSALQWRVALCTFAKQTQNKTKQNPHPLSVSCLLLTRSVCGQEHTVLLLGPFYQLPPLLLGPLLLCFGWSLPCNGGKRKADWSEKAFSRKESTKHGEF